MAIFHLSAKVISRSAGRSAVSAAAYRSGSELFDERLQRAQDFSRKPGVVFSQVRLPNGAPGRWRDRATLWNEIERIEVRRDAVLAREVEVALPRELSQVDAVKLAVLFADRAFVDRGMVADVNVHWDIGSDGEARPHAHIMLSMRQVGSDGFGLKVREWNDVRLLRAWREEWAVLSNSALAERGIDRRIDHRSYEALGIDLVPQNKIGPAGRRREERGEDAERVRDHVEIARENGERIIADPEIALAAVTAYSSTFTLRDLQRVIFRHTADADQFVRALAIVRASPELVSLGRDGRGEERFSSRAMIEVEERMARMAHELVGARSSPIRHELAPAVAERRGLTAEQREALSHVVGGGRLRAVIGVAGAGKSRMLGAAAEVWREAGYTVLGGALSGIAAENLEAGSQIPSRTLASLERAWSGGHDLLGRRDVLVIDEAGMIGSRQLGRLIEAVRDAGAKAVLVGDVEQLQAIEAGAAFRAIVERAGAAELRGVLRQLDDWQRDLVRHLSAGRTGLALEGFAQRGLVTEARDHASAVAELISTWRLDRMEGRTQIILAPTRSDVAELNLAARMSLRVSGNLGPDRTVETDRGERQFAVGDQVVFLRNERSLEVKNGTLGRVLEIEEGAEGRAKLKVRVAGDVGREVEVATSYYGAIDHGYAMTVHKSQGSTFDRAYVLAGPSMDRHMTYVALSRHREAVQVFWSRESFEDARELGRVLSRERLKDTTLDYALRRDIQPSPSFRDRATEIGRSIVTTVHRALGIERGHGIER